MNYIYSYIAPYSQDGCIEVEILSESEVYERLHSHIGLVNEFDTVEALIRFIDEYQMFNIEGGERITVATLSGEILFQAS